MQVGLWGLAVWSFLMATAHGAGLMLWPLLMTSCVSTSSNEAALAAPFATALAGVGLHTLAMLITTAFVAVLIYEWVGLSILRRARFVQVWAASIGLDASKFGTHSLRRTKAVLIYRRTGNLRAVQLLLGHTKIESTVRYLGIEVDDAIEIAEKIDI